MHPSIGKSVKPTSQAERIHSLDFLRGLAILGILFINVENFAYPDSWSPWKYGFDAELDRNTRFWVYFLTQGKFATMFTLLFGVGFYVFMERLEKKGLGLVAIEIYSRRLLWLFIIGVFHAYFIWNGDVLYHYAICGLLLFPFRSLSNKALLFSMLVLILVQANNSFEKVSQRRESFNNYLAIKSCESSERTPLENKRVNYWNSFLKEKLQNKEEVIPPKETYLKGLVETYRSATVHKGMLYYQGFFFPTLMMMIMGIYLYRSGIFTSYHSWKHYWLITLSLLIIGVTLNYFRYYHWTFTYFQPVLSFWKDLSFTFHKQILGVAYILLFNGVYQKFLSRRKIWLVSLVGRTALSNYLLQNILMSFLFYGYGLAMYNRYSRSDLLLVVLVIWVIQILLSWLWDKKYSQGPAEWFWKKMTYKSSSLS